MYANVAGLAFGSDKHPHRLLRSRKAIQETIDGVRALEDRGLVFQAAHLMKALVSLHAFAGGNHRAAFLVAAVFLRKNGMHLKVERFDEAYAFISRIETKSIEQIQEWIQNG